MKRSPWLVIIGLLSAILLPIIFSGYADVKKGQAEFAAQDYAAAADSFKRAALYLPWRSKLWEQAGIAAGMNADPAGAITFLDHAPQLSEQGWVMLGASYLNTGDTSAALTAYQQGIQSYDSAALFAGLAFIYRQQKDWTAESGALKNQTRLDDGNVYAHYRLGLLLTVLEPGNALPSLMRASSLDPQTDPAVQTLRAALNVSAAQSDPSQKMLTLGRALGLVREWELSMAAFEKAITLNAEDAEAWAWLGEAKQQAGGDGIVELDRAMTLAGRSVIVRALRGLYFDRQKKYPQMLAEYKFAAASEPSNPAWQASIGDAYSKSGDLVAALAAYQHATEIAPDDATYWRLLSAFCADNNVHVEDVGLPAAQKAVDLAPDDALALDALGWSYFSSGRYANAERILLDVISRFPDHLPAHIHLAMTYIAQGNRAAALAELTFVRDADAGGADGSFAVQLLQKYFP